MFINTCNSSINPNTVKDEFDNDITPFSK